MLFLKKGKKERKKKKEKKIKKKEKRRKKMEKKKKNEKEIENKNSAKGMILDKYIVFLIYIADFSKEIEIFNKNNNKKNEVRNLLKKHTKIIIYKSMQFLKEKIKSFKVRR